MTINVYSMCFADAVYGFILQNQTSAVEECFAKYTSKHHHIAYDLLDEHIDRLEVTNSISAEACFKWVVLEKKFIHCQLKLII